MTRSRHPRSPLRSWLPAAAAFAVLSLLAFTGARVAGAARTSPKTTFSSPTVVDPTHAYGEPDVKIAAGGLNSYDSGPWRTGTHRSIWNLSSDGGHTFHSLHSPAVSSPAES